MLWGRGEWGRGLLEARGETSLTLSCIIFSKCPIHPPPAPPPPAVGTGRPDWEGCQEEFAPKDPSWAC